MTASGNLITVSLGLIVGIAVVLLFVLVSLRIGVVRAEWGWALET